MEQINDDDDDSMMILMMTMTIIVYICDVYVLQLMLLQQIRLLNVVKLQPGFAVGFSR